MCLLGLRMVRWGMWGVSGCSSLDCPPPSEGELPPLEGALGGEGGDSDWKGLGIRLPLLLVGSPSSSSDEGEPTRELGALSGSSGTRGSPMGA